MTAGGRSTGSRRPGARELFLATRPYSLLNSVSRAIVGGAAAMATSAGLGLRQVAITAMVAVGVAAFQASENLINDYFDTSRGYDTPDSPSATLRGHSVFTYGLSLKDVLRLGLSLLVFGSALVVIATVLLGRPLLPVFLAVGALLLWSYNGRPLELKYRGLGELDVFLSAMIMVAGSYYTVSGRVPLYAWVLSIPVALLSASVALADDIRDLEWDRLHGVGTLAVRLGGRASRSLYTAMVAAALSLPTALLRWPWGTLTLIAAPIAVPIVLQVWGVNAVKPDKAVRYRFYLTLTFAASYIAAFTLSSIGGV